MIHEIQKLLDDYIAWLKDKTILRQIDDWVEITTPYLDRHNDYIQIYAKRENNGFVLTDDGYTIEDLEQSGCKLDSPKRQDLLKMTLNGFGVQLHRNTLTVRASQDNFAIRKHNLVQAMLAVNDMFYLAAPMVASLFYEDVVAWLDLHDVRYTPKVKFTGKTGYDHLFDFVIPKSRRQPERIIQTINRPSRDTAQAVAFAFGHGLSVVVEHFEVDIGFEQELMLVLAVQVDEPITDRGEVIHSDVWGRWRLALRPGRVTSAEIRGSSRLNMLSLEDGCQST